MFWRLMSQTFAENQLLKTKFEECARNIEQQQMSFNEVIHRIGKFVIACNDVFKNFTKFSLLIYLTSTTIEKRSHFRTINAFHLRFAHLKYPEGDTTSKDIFIWPICSHAIFILLKPR